MENNKLIQYWVETSDDDYGAMNNLYKAGNYNWSLFIGHLVIEKLLKALYVSKNQDNPVPKSHDLLYLANKSNIEVTEDLEEKLDLITTFNINVRYPDYKKEFYNKCTEEYTRIQINIIEELRLWLKEQLITK